MKNLRESKTHKSIFRRRSVWEQWSSQISLAVGAGLLVAIAGAALSAPYWRSHLGKSVVLGRLLGSVNEIHSNKPIQSVVPLLAQPSAKRAAKLEEIADQPQSIDRNRARFLLANDLLQQKQAKKALTLLDGLESDYPVMGGYVLLKRAQAYELLADNKKAEETWQDLLNHYPKEQVAAEALSALSISNPKYADRAIEQFPSHPRTLEIVRRRLEQNSNQPKLMLLLTKYSFETPNTSLLDRLVQQSASSLKPEDWENIAFDYLQNREYAKASATYEKAPHNPRNAYRVAKTLELAGKKAEAKVAYELVVQEFPTAKEAGASLLKAANLSKLEDTVPILDQVIARFPDSAGEALIGEAKVLDRLKSPKAAEEARQTLVSKYGSSEAAAEYRWNMAQKRAAAGDWQGAWKWAQPITSQSPNSKFAPRAGFWVGKWANKLGRQQEAKASFEYVLAKYPQSYYAWRSAVLLGLPVGDFNTVRKLEPEVVRPAERPLLPAGSDTLKELYQLHLDQDAWTLWQAEFQNRVQPTVTEQFTDGLLQLARGNHLEGISLVSTLEDRETPEDQTEYQKLRQQPSYWQALYPFPFMEAIEASSKQRKINPLLVTALIRQESRFMPTIHSAAGAVGLMQVMPSTATWIAPRINLKEYKLDNPKDNISIGTWYLDSTHQQYNNNSMLAVASYNAGPGNVSKWMKDKASMEPDEFVETIPFEETKGYVKNVFGNYWNYSRLYNPQVSQLLAKFSVSQATLLSK